MRLVELDVRSNGVPKTIVVGLERLRRGLRNPGKSQGELIAKWRRRGLRHFAEFASSRKPTIANGKRLTFAKRGVRLGKMKALKPRKPEVRGKP